MNRCSGFSLLELVIVVAMIAIAATAITLALPDPQAAQLEREAERLAALLEAGRAEARASGLKVSWVPVRDDSGDAFRFQGLPPKVQLPTRWLSEPVNADVVGARALLLGPEPYIGPQRLRLRLGQQQLLLITDGLAPFALQREDAN
ncbi:prepilin-type N-terminal cleavage/methylation domain-containing protein [Pelomonas sp. V22]|uniref:prepilin-type N-terminal cleavage/methylation domain-containing protein n=1 Tax=Pelomonas sp. V22 TaxID=2822139 RepID=UPI0024A7FE04|nr:prepilin-type N-terminal cleavage/methylation domain-containing protein [Pelomonas sp. V22]